MAYNDQNSRKNEKKYIEVRVLRTYKAETRDRSNMPPPSPIEIKKSGSNLPTATG
jgi:hypothetical protein